MRMTQPRDDLDLAQKSLGPYGLRQSGMEHLERDDAVVLGILRETDRRHPTATELAVDLLRCDWHLCLGEAGVSSSAATRLHASSLGQPTLRWAPSPSLLLRET